MQLVSARLKEFFREPEANFWVYGFPLLMVVGLGISGFRNQPVGKSWSIFGPAHGQRRPQKPCRPIPDSWWRPTTDRPSAGCTRGGQETVDVVSVAGSPAEYVYRFDPTRPESLLARDAVNDALEKAAGPSIPVKPPIRFSTNREGDMSIFSCRV